MLEAVHFSASTSEVDFYTTLAPLWPSFLNFMDTQNRGFNEGLELTETIWNDLCPAIQNSY